MLERALRLPQVWNGKSVVMAQIPFPGAHPMNMQLNLDTHGSFLVLLSLRYAV